MDSPASCLLPDGRRLHLQHGPIDLIVEAFGPDRVRALSQATTRFQTVLDELVAELDLVRSAVRERVPKGRIARRMIRAVTPFAPVFITPMAAVAGAVADEICDAMSEGCTLTKAYVNNGGDIAVWLAKGQQLCALIHERGDAGRVHLSADTKARGLATSGWRGRSHSLGIADAVSVVAASAAAADAAATLIANAVDLPGHRAVKRHPANTLSSDSDLGDRLVTVDVGPLNDWETERALSAGRKVALDMIRRGLIDATALFLNGKNVSAGQFPLSENKLIDGENDVRFQIA